MFSYNPNSLAHNQLLLAKAAAITQARPVLATPLLTCYQETTLPWHRKPRYAPIAPARVFSAPAATTRGVRAELTLTVTASPRASSFPFPFNMLPANAPSCKTLQLTVIPARKPAFPPCIRAVPPQLRRRAGLQTLPTSTARDVLAQPLYNGPNIRVFLCRA
jgi:hypothetical protein